MPKKNKKPFLKERLYLSEDNRIIAGVCAGIAEYFDVDPTITRLLAFILLLIIPLPTILIYLLLWAITPKKSEIKVKEKSEKSLKKKKSD